MASGGSTGFTKAVAKEAGAAEQLNQLIEAWEGGTDRGVPLDLTEVEHATKYALDVRNKETDSSLGARIRNAAGEVLFQAIKNAVTIGKLVTFTGTAVMPDDFLSADATGWDMMEDGFLAANATAQAKMADGFVTAAKVAADVATQAELDTHTEATTGIHGAVSTDTASKLVIRDAAKRARFADPSAAQDAATKAYVDAHAALTAPAPVHGSAVAATPNTIIHRDANARAHMGAPAQATEIAIKANVDAVQTNLNTHKTSADHDGRYFTEAEQDARFAPIAKGVTSGDSHDHAGGDGAQIPLAGHADNSVDDTKVGNRVPALTRRQGGSATDWNTQGTTTYTPTAVRMQAGYARVTIAAGATTGTVDITFPVAFSYKPLVFLSHVAQTVDAIADTGFTSIATTGFTIAAKRTVGDGPINIDFSWLAIGPE